MMVRGLKNRIVLDSKGENALIPWIDIFRISAILKNMCLAGISEMGVFLVFRDDGCNNKQAMIC